MGIAVPGFFKVIFNPLGHVTHHAVQTVVVGPIALDRGLSLIHI
jgi:hypothetical protein